MDPWHRPRDHDFEIDGNFDMRRVFFLAVSATASVYAVAHAGDLPSLPNTVLYKEVAHDCHTVDLTTWNHPTKQVLTKDHVQLYSLELCNAGKYPIFHVNFKYDPMGLTDSFFLPFY